MEFDFSKDEQAFADEVAQYLQQVHSDDVMQPWKENFTQLVDTQPKRDFLKKLSDKGWLGITWPKELGGQEKPGVLEYLLNEALAYVGAPQIGKGIGIVGKTLIRHGSDKLKQEFLPKILNAEIEFAVHFSVQVASQTQIRFRECSAIDEDLQFLVQFDIAGNSSGCNRCSSNCSLSTAFAASVLPAPVTSRYRSHACLNWPVDSNTRIRPICSSDNRPVGSANESNVNARDSRMHSETMSVT